MEEQGYIKLYTGCMFSSKSASLIEQAVKAKKQNLSISCYKSNLHTRDGDYIVSRRYPEIKLACNMIQTPFEMIGSKADVVILDETHFFNGQEKELRATLLRLKHKGKQVYCAGLNYDAEGEYFSATKAIVDIANSIEVLEARCTKWTDREQCNKPAKWTERIGGNPKAKLQVETDKISYEPRCTSCFSR